MALIIIQAIAFVLSGILFQQVATRIIKRPKVIFWTVALYLFVDSVSFYSVYILTDIWGFVGSTLFLWLLFRRYPAIPKTVDIVWLSALLLVLIMLRPFFVYLIIASVIVYFCIWVKYGKTAVKQIAVGVVGLCLVFGALQVYKGAITRTHGIKSVSIVSSVNNYFTVRKTAELNPSLTSNPTLQALLTKYNAELPIGNKGRTPNNDQMWEEIGEIFDTVPLADFEEYVNAQMASQKADVIKYIFSYRSRSAMNYKAFGFEICAVYPFFVITMTGLDAVSPSIAQVLVFIGIFVILSIISWRRSKKIPYVALSLAVISAGAIVGSIVGAQDEWTRLSIPGMPALYLMIGLFASKFSFRKTFME